MTFVETAASFSRLRGLGATPRDTIVCEPSAKCVVVRDTTRRRVDSCQFIDSAGVFATRTKTTTTTTGQTAALPRAVEREAQ